jgi:tetratricopeptide (TPR) repeat protein
MAFSDIIDAVTDECTVVLAIEDCQWIDAASAMALERLIARLKNQRILFLFTSRFVEGSPIGDAMPQLPEVRLPALLDEPSAEIVRTIARHSGRQVDDEYLRWCTSVAEGNPFFLHELASHWVETGNEHAAPPSLTAVLRQRLSRLSPNAIQVLQACALLENHATVDNVEAVLGYPAHEQLRCINELASAGMVSIQQGDVPSSDGGRISSRHDLLSDTALMLLASPARTYLHRRAAKLLESRINDTRDASTLWSCAKHWQLAGDSVQAFRLANSCAYHLLEAGLPSEAVDAFSKAIDYCGTDADLLTVLEGQATAYYRGSNWVQVVSLVGQARTIKDRLFPDLGNHDELELMLRRAEWQTMNWDHILTHSLKCLSADEATAAHRLEAGVMALMLLSLHGDRATGTDTFERMRKLDESADVGPELMLQARMIFNTSWGSLNDAVDAATALVSEQKKKRDIGALFRSLCNAGITLRVAGSFDDASEYFHEALSLAERHRIYLSKSQALPMLAHLSIEQGRLDEARAWLDALRECPAPAGDRMIRTEIGAIQARLSLAAGHFLDARQLVENDLIHMRVDQLPHRRTYWSALKVAVELATDGVASRDALDELEREHLQTRGNIFQAFASYALYVGLLSKGKTRRAKKLLDEYLTIYRREPWPPPTHLLDSLATLLSEKPKAARAALNRI